MNHRVCPECGARLAPGAERCDLCGAPLENVDSGGEGPIVEAGDGTASGEAPARPSERPAGADDIPEPKSPPLHCAACGAENPPEANYCSRCGARLHHPHDSGMQEAPSPGESGSEPHRRAETAPASTSKPAPASTSKPAPVSTSKPGPEDAPRAVPAPPRPSESEGSLTRHVGVLIGLSVLVVVALYLITVISKQRAPEQPDAVASAPAEARAASVVREREAVPIAEAYRGTVDSLKNVIENADGVEAVQARRRLADFLIGIGRIDRAAIEQQRVARLTDEASDWKKAGNLLFDWMETSEPNSKTNIALLAIDAYKQLLQQRPDDLDARADLGWAYQYDPQHPMEAIRQTNLVLEEEPEHLTANYNKGVFLMRINRLDQAVEQFERVKTIAGAESPYHRQADMWIETIRKSQSQDGAS